MRRMTTVRFGAAAWAIALVLGCGRDLVADTIVYSNAGAPGDTVTGTPTPGSNVAIGSSGWSYGNVRTGATVGIRDAIDFPPALGNGSVLFYSNGSGAKADVVYNPGAVLGQVKDLSAFSYSWYRSSTSTSSDWLVPSLRLLITDGVNFGSLNYEPAYNEYAGGPPLPVPTNSWQTSNAFDGGDGVFWTSGSLPFSGGGAYLEYSDWAAPISSGGQGLGDYFVYGISSGVGSGWSGTFYGAMDGITIGFGGSTPTVFNFEVVPEPSSIVLSLLAGGLGVVEVARRRLRRAA